MEQPGYMDDDYDEIVSRDNENAEARQRLALNAVAIATSTSLMLGSQGEIEPRSIRTDVEPPWVEVIHNGERYRLVVEKL